MQIWMGRFDLLVAKLAGDKGSYTYTWKLPVVILEWGSDGSVTRGDMSTATLRHVP